MDEETKQEQEQEDRGDEFTPDEEEQQSTAKQQQDSEEESKDDFLDRLAGMSEEEADAELEKLQSLGKLEDYFPDEEEKEQEDQQQAPMIPKARFDEALAKERARTAALEERLNRLEQERQQPLQQPQGPTLAEQLSEVRKQKIKAMQDEDWSRVAELEEQHERLIEKKVSEHAEQLASRKAREAGETVSRQSLQEKLNELSDQIVGRHPELAEDTAEARGRVDAFEAWRDFYIMKKQMSPVKAMLEAEKMVFPEQREAKQKSDPDALRRAILKRREDTLKKKIRTNESQPPKAGGRTHGSAALAKDVAKMSDEEFAKLTPTELARARGDILEVEE